MTILELRNNSDSASRNEHEDVEEIKIERNVPTTDYLIGQSMISNPYLKRCRKRRISNSNEDGNAAVVSSDVDIDEGKGFDCL